MLHKALLSTLAAASAAILVATAPAGAADDVAPTPCNGVFVSDKAGDQLADPAPAVNVVPLQRKAEDNLDVRDIFFNARPDAEGKMKLTANLSLTNLTKDVPDESQTGSVSYTVDFDTLDNGVSYVVARNDGGDISYWVGTYGETPFGPGTGLLEEVETTGSWVEGPMGVISIDLPAELATSSLKLENAFARVSLTNMEEEFYVGYNTADLAPDDGATSKKSYSFAECPAVVAPVEQAVEVAPVVPAVTTQAPAVQPAPVAAAPVAKKVSKRAACQKKARKIKNKRKRAKALKRCRRIKA